MFDGDNQKLLLGVTATPARGDGRGLDNVFQKIVFSMPILDAIKKGWLCDLRAYRIRTNIDLDDVQAHRDGDFAEAELGQAVDTRSRNCSIVRNWFELGKHRQTVAFCVTIEHAKHLTEAFRAEGVSAEFVWGGDPDRSTKLKNHRNGETRVLANCGVLTEGYDDWQISCVLLARPTKSELLFTQMIGRGTRIQEGIDNLVVAREQNQDIRKPDCIVIDVVDSSRRHRLVNMATLFGHETGHDFCGECVSRVGREVQYNAQTEPRLVPEIGINEMTALIEEVDLFAPKWSDGLLNRSVLQWFRSGNSFLLPLPGGEKIAVEHNGNWKARGIVGGERFDSGPLDSFADALARGEHLFKFLAKDLVERLRMEEHADSDSITPIQKDLLGDVDDQEWRPNLTRDEAAHRIARAYERELHARCVSLLPTEEESQSDDNQAPGTHPDEIEAAIALWIMPEPWRLEETSESVLRWYRTNEHGYAMPLPDMGEIVLFPQDSYWRLSGEICGARIDEQSHESLQAAFEASKSKMERMGAEVLAAINAEQDWVGSEPSPMQRRLLRNLFGPIAGQQVDDRAAAQHLIQSLYTCEYDPGAADVRGVTDGYTTQFMERCRLDRDGIYEALETED